MPQRPSRRQFLLLALTALLAAAPAAQPRKILWGDEVPPAWTGKRLHVQSMFTSPMRKVAPNPPQARDGFDGWHVLDEARRALGAHERSAVYPTFKARALPWQPVL